MKKKFEHPARESKPTLWRTQSERENSDEFNIQLSREFSDTASGRDQEALLSRRDFVRLMGAATALSGVGITGCRRPESHLVPFAKSAEWSIPGKFLYYATAMPSPLGAIPLIVTTVDGRPTKIEGNPLHPISNGSTDIFSQASVLNLYDPHRSKEITHNGDPCSRSDLDQIITKIRNTANNNSGDGLAILIGMTNSPTIERLRSSLITQFPKLLWIQDEAIPSNHIAMDTLLEVGARFSYDFKKADVILAIGSDFLNPTESGFGFANGFFNRRDPKGSGSDKMNRLYVVENHFTLTGGMADHRLCLRTSSFGAFVASLATIVAEKIGDSNLKILAATYPHQDLTFDPAWIRGLADDLLIAKNHSIIITDQSQPPALQALVFGINKALDNLGSTIYSIKTRLTPEKSLGDLCKFIKEGTVQTLLILEGNPVYTAPVDFKFTELLSLVPETLHLSLFADETSKITRWHIPASHYLECWGDGRSIDGTVCSIQPMILPLWHGISSIEILAMLAGEEPNALSAVRTSFSSYSKDSSDIAWQTFLKNGFVSGTEWPLSTPTFYQANALEAVKKAPKVSDAFEIVFLRSSSVDDGRYANNSWLQETPDFVTKLVWDNAALLSPADAKILGVKDGDWLRLTTGARSIEVAMLIAPGHADQSISIALGYGRRGISHVMENVGFDAYPLRSSENLCFQTDVTVKHLSRKTSYTFARTQEYQNMEGRNLAREGTLHTFQEKPGFAQAMDHDTAKPLSIYPNPPLTSDLQWGLSIDLNSCIGCNTCLVACQSENNIPVVGKDQIRRGRDMAWIRIDRWFASADHKEENLEMIPMPVMCQQCENAPCESVCPANATLHSEEGLNLMAYNRCIGTRYCANNCPWKVRRFNWFDYNNRPLNELYYGPLAPKGMADSLKMAKNPNVTVRMRGVMEKCTFCIQRIEEAKIARSVKAGDSDVSKIPLPSFQTACQQACPSKAIVFGNIKDPQSAVSKAKADARTYTSLHYLNTRPRVTYMAKIRNPNQAMPGAELVGAANFCVEKI